MPLLNDLIYTGPIGHLGSLDESQYGLEVLLRITATPSTGGGVERVAAARTAQRAGG